VSGDVALTAIKKGAHVTIREIDAAADDRLRLNSLGLCVGRSAQVVKSGDPLVVRVLGARVGISARLAGRVFVEQHAPASP
jgi:Fe2+ transport system protein FeoA